MNIFDYNDVYLCIFLWSIILTNHVPYTIITIFSYKLKLYLKINTFTSHQSSVENIENLNHRCGYTSDLVVI